MRTLHEAIQERRNELEEIERRQREEERQLEEGIQKTLDEAVYYLITYLSEKHNVCIGDLSMLVWGGRVHGTTACEIYCKVGEIKLHLANYIEKHGNRYVLGVVKVQNTDQWYIENSTDFDFVEFDSFIDGILHIRKVKNVRDHKTP